MNWKRLMFVFALSVMLILSSLAAAVKRPFTAPAATLLATDLEELQGSTVGPDGALYVTAPLAGSIWRVDPKTGAVTLFATGLPKRIPGLYYIGSGVVDVAFLDGTAYALVTGVASDLDGHDIVGIYRVDGPDSFTIVADLGAWSAAHPPATDYFVATGFQYAIVPYRGGFIVTDGHHNRVLRVTLDGQINEMIAFADVVPTGLAVRGNTIYITEAGPIPHLPESGKVMAFTLSSPTATQVASGAGLDHIGLFVDVEFGLGNTLYALAQGYWNGPYEGTPAEPNTGALLKVNLDGTTSIIVAGLNQPTSMEFIGNTTYVVSLAGEVWKIENVSSPPFGH
ncbi:MAG: ScyD/ScyE family protein [Syntrophothermus sp.]